jgi:hypothetical protein
MTGNDGRPTAAENPVDLLPNGGRYRARAGVALHGFIKKSRATPDEDLALARKRQKELMR